MWIQVVLKGDFMYKISWLREGVRRLSRALVLLVVACCSLPLQANAVDPMQVNAADSAVPSWQGVWDGTIGKSKVTVCLAANGKSAYSYQRYQTDIPLLHHGDEWEESVNGVVSGVWRLTEAQGDSLEGDWQNPKSQRTLPIHLKKIAVENNSAPCESRAYKSGTSGGASATEALGTAVSTGGEKRSEYVYVANQGDKTVSAYRISAATGMLTPIKGSPFAIGISPSSVTVNPAGTFAYVLVSKDGLDSVSDTEILIYRINAATGTLTRMTGNPVWHGKSYVDPTNISMTIDPTGSFAYIINDYSILAYRINTSTGRFTQVHGGSIAVPEYEHHPLFVKINSAGTFAFVEMADVVGTNMDSDTSGIVSTYRINTTTGALTRVSSVSFNTGIYSDLTVNHAGTFAYAVSDNGSISGYRINVASGTLSKVKGSTFAVADSSVNSVAINSAGTFAYVVSDDGIISTYRINATTGALTAVSGSSFKTGAQPISVTINRTNGFAYVLNAGDPRGSISAYRINAKTGALTPLMGSRFATKPIPESIAINAKGAFAYVANDGMSLAAAPGPVVSGSVSAYRVNTTTGALTPVAGSSFTTGLYHYDGNFSASTHRINPIRINPIKGATKPQFTIGMHPWCVTINPAGTFVYAAIIGDQSIINGIVSAYHIHATTGALEPVAGSPFAAGLSPQSVTVNPAGTFAYVANGGDNNVSVYRINATTGVLSPVAGSPFAAGFSPQSVTVNLAGTFAYVANKHDRTISAYHINAATGALAPVVGSPFVEGVSPVSVAINPASTFAYVANSGGTISAYRINATTGALTQIHGSPFATGKNPTSIAINPAGTLAYVTNDSGTISAYRINAATGALTAIAGSPFAEWKGEQPSSITVNPAGTFAYVTNTGADNVAVYSINATTGALTSIGSPFAVGVAPQSLTIVQP